MKKYILLILIFILASYSGMAAKEVLCFTERITNAPSFNIYTGRNDANNPIKWTHNIPEGILERVVRVGLYIEAYDVDYPSNDEHDRVFFNGYDLGLLEGINNTWITVEKTVPVEALKSGINDLKVIIDELGKTWKVTIRASELRFYCSTEEPDFSIGISPDRNEVNPGESASFKVDLVALNGFNHNVSLSVSGLPGNCTWKFAPNPVIPTNSSELLIKTNVNTPIGKYNIKVTGVGGGKTHSDNIELIIREGGFDGSILNNFSKDEAKSGDIVFLNIKYKNNSNIDMKNIEVYSKFSDHLEYLSDDSGYSPGIKDGNYSWIIPNLDAYITKNINVKFKIKEDNYKGNIINVSYMKHSSIDFVIKSNTANLRIHEENIVLKKIVDKVQIKPLDELKYTLIVKNNSSFAVKELEIEDIISDNLEFISHDSDQIFIRTENKLVWKVDIDIDKEIRIEIKAKVKSSVFSDVIINNRFQVKSPDLKDILESNMVSTKVSSEPAVLSKVIFKKRTENRQTEVGRIVRFNFLIENNSNSVLIAPRIKDQLPQGFAYVAGTSVLNGVKIADPVGKNVLTWTLPDFPPHRSMNLRFQTIIGADVKRGKNINRGYLYTMDSTGQNINLESSDFINVSISGFVFYSEIEGTVFIDIDKDEFYSPSDRPLEGIEVRLSTGDKAFTNKVGEYSFKDLKPGEYAINVNRVTLPEKYRMSTPYPKMVVLSDGLTDTADFPILFTGDDPEKSARLECRVFFDKNSNNVFDADDQLAEKFIAVLDKKSTFQGKNGKAVFTHLKPGSHIIEIKYGNKTEKKEININKGKQVEDIPLPYSAIKIIVEGESK